MKLLSWLNRRSGSVRAAAIIISVSYLLSRLLGLLRDRLLASNFGIGPTTDAYAAAFRLPETLFTLLVSGAFVVAFIPVMAQHLEKNERDEAWQVSSVLLNLLGLITLVAAAIMWLFADPLTTLVAPGFNAEQHRLTVELTRIMLITPFLFTISSVLGGIQQSFNRFLWFAMASVFYNLGIIFGIVVLNPDMGIHGVAWGVVMGTALQVLVQVFGLRGLGFKYRFSWRVRHPSVLKTLRLMIPRTIDQGLDQLHFLIETMISSRLSPGSLAAFTFANNLKNVPLILIGNAIATAAFPQMAARAAKGSIDKLKDEFVVNARLILFLVLPAAAIAFLMRGYIVRLLFGFGDATTANTLGWFAGTIVFQSLFFLVVRIYYATQDSKTPLYASIVAIGLNIPLSFGLSELYGVAGLAMAQSLIAALETVALLLILRRRLGGLGGREIWRGLYRMLLGTAVMSGAVYVMVALVLPLYAEDRGFIIIGSKFLAIMVVAAVAYLVPCYLLRLREVTSLLRRLKEQVTRPLNLT